MRYLLDTCILVSALRSRNGASNALLRLVFARGLRVVVHFKLIAEYRDLLLRKENLAATGLGEDQVDRFLSAYVGLAEEVQVHYLWRPNLTDEDDNFIMEIAIAASPCTIVTHNMRDFLQAERQFAGIRVLQPAALLQSRHH